MDWPAFAETLSKSLNQSMQILTTHPLRGGDIHQAFQLHTQVGDFFLKLNQAHTLPLFSTEKHNLTAIQNSYSIRCPKPLADGIHHDQAWLLLEFLHLTAQGDDYQRGKDLALMHHQINRDSAPFGWFEDNFIGLNRQNNRWQSDWLQFYGQQRLLPQLELAVLRDAPATLYQKGIRLIEVLPFWFQDYQPKASLLHGDLWGGNSAFSQEGDAVVFDPACYYGDHETDLAMSELFGGFSSAFYQGYQTVFSIDSGYQQRKPLYNLYHMLNHFNLFGGHYAQQAEAVIDQLLRSAHRT